MASEKPNRDDYFVARPLEASEHAFIVETVADAVHLAFLGPVAVTRMTFTRAEGPRRHLPRDRGGQQIDEEDE